MDAARAAGDEGFLTVACMRPVILVATRKGFGVERLTAAMRAKNGYTTLMRKLSTVACADVAVSGAADVRAEEVLEYLVELLPEKAPLDATDISMVRALAPLLRKAPSETKRVVGYLVSLLQAWLSMAGASGPEGGTHEWVGVACQALCACAAVSRDASEIALQAVVSILEQKGGSSCEKGEETLLRCVTNPKPPAQIPAWRRQLKTGQTVCSVAVSLILFSV